MHAVIYDYIKIALIIIAIEVFETKYKITITITHYYKQTAQTHTL